MGRMAVWLSALFCTLTARMFSGKPWGSMKHTFRHLFDMQKEINIRVVPEVAYQAKELKQHVARELGLDVRSVSAVQVRRRSIDARQRTIYVNLSLTVFVGEEPCAAFEPVAYREVHDAAPVIVVGAGPGGLFAALRLIELGKRPIVLERGDRKSVV